MKKRKPAVKKRKVPRKLGVQTRIARDLRSIASDLNELREATDDLREHLYLMAKGIAPLIYDLRCRPDEIGFDPDDFVVFDDMVKHATDGWGHG